MENYNERTSIITLKSIQIYIQACQHTEKLLKIEEAYDVFLQKKKNRLIFLIYYKRRTLFAPLPGWSNTVTDNSLQQYEGRTIRPGYFWIARNIINIVHMLPNSSVRRTTQILSSECSIFFNNLFIAKQHLSFIHLFLK